MRARAVVQLIRKTCEVTTTRKAHRGMNDRPPSHLAKLAQARKHLRHLHHIAGRLQDSDAYAVYTERDPSTGEVVIYGEARRAPPSLTWGVVIGDIVHNLRSALDHMVWALTVAHQPEAPPHTIPSRGPGSEWRHTAFPVHPKPYPLDASGELIPWENAKEPRSLWGMEPALRAEFETLQPFRWKEEAAFHPLAILHDLWNIDKHRHFHLAHFNVGSHEIFGPPPYPRIPGIEYLRARLTPRGPFEGRTELGRLSWANGHVPLELDRYINPTVFFDISFGYGPPAYGAQVTQLLDSLYDEVVLICGRFQPHLR